MSILAIAFAVIANSNALPARTWELGEYTKKSAVHRIHDVEAGVVCYVIPQSQCVGDCAYSPAISCVRLAP